MPSGSALDRIPLPNRAQIPPLTGSACPHQNFPGLERNVLSPIWGMPRNKCLPKEISSRLIMVLRRKGLAKTVRHKIISNQKRVYAGQSTSYQRIAFSVGHFCDRAQRGAAIIRSAPAMSCIVFLGDAHWRPRRLDGHTCQTNSVLRGCPRTARPRQTLQGEVTKLASDHVAQRRIALAAPIGGRVLN